MDDPISELTTQYYLTIKGCFSELDLLWPMQRRSLRWASRGLRKKAVAAIGSLSTYPRIRGRWHRPSWQLANPRRSYARTPRALLARLGSYRKYRNQWHNSLSDGHILYGYRFSCTYNVHVQLYLRGYPCSCSVRACMSTLVCANKSVSAAHLLVCTRRRC